MSAVSVVCSEARVSATGLSPRAVHEVSSVIVKPRQRSVLLPLELSYHEHKYQLEKDYPTTCSKGPQYLFCVVLQAAVIKVTINAILRSLNIA